MNKIEALFNSEFKICKTDLLKLQIKVSIDDLARQVLINRGYTPEMDVRSLRRVIHQYIENPLVQKTLNHPGIPQTYLISAKGHQIIFIAKD
ncbi:MAG: hypothetical protein K2X08_00280 [Chlamydiales bacterium]|nr:hypothetical protein [Chlamydiales bacterium]